MNLYDKYFNTKYFHAKQNSKQVRKYQAHSKETFEAADIGKTENKRQTVVNSSINTLKKRKANSRNEKPQHKSVFSTDTLFYTRFKKFEALDECLKKKRSSLHRNQSGIASH